MNPDTKPQSPSAAGRRKNATRSLPRTPSATRWRLPGALLAMGVALCASTDTNYGQTSWETSDTISKGDTVDLTGGTTAVVGTVIASGVSADAYGNLFVAGSIQNPGGTGGFGIIRQSTDQGQTWFTCDVNAVALARITSKGGASIGAGWGANRACIIRGRYEGVNGGLWNDLGNFIHPNAAYSIGVIWDVELDDQGNIYVVAEYREQTRKGPINHSVIIKREAGVWKSIETPFPLTKIVATNGVIYGTGEPEESATSWQVRRSTDGGYTWALLNSYVLDSDSNTRTRAADIAVDLEGNLFVVGSAIQFVTTTIKGKKTTTSRRYWVTRQGRIASDGSFSWSTVDLFQHGSSGTNTFNNNAYAITVDALNNVHVVGIGGTTYGLDTIWVTRQLAPSLLTGEWEWTTSDEVNLLPSYNTRGLRTAADPFGNVFAVGDAISPSANEYGSAALIVRRKLAPANLSTEP